MNYFAPVRDMEFVLNELAGLAGINALPGFEEATPDLVSAVLEEAGKFSSEVLAPLNKVGHAISERTGVRFLALITKLNARLRRRLV